MLLLVLMVQGWVSVARAQSKPAPGAPAELPQRQAAFERSDDWVVMTASWRDVVDPKIRARLGSGLPTVIAARAYLFAGTSEQPAALSVKTCRVAYDLWDEVFRVEIRQGGQRTDTIAVNVEGVLRRCAEANRLPIVAAQSLRANERYFVGLLVEVNPISKQMLERIRRWVSLPKGAGAVGPGDSLFGSFVGLFVTQVPSADRRLAFRTPTFALGELRKVEPPRSTR
jgi:hypothetical protein